MVNFDGDPTADSEQYNKLDRSTRDQIESLVCFSSLITQLFFINLRCIEHTSLV